MVDRVTFGTGDETLNVEFFVDDPFPDPAFRLFQQMRSAASFRVGFREDRKVHIRSGNFKIS